MGTLENRPDFQCMYSHSRVHFHPVLLCLVLVLVLVQLALVLFCLVVLVLDGNEADISPGPPLVSWCTGCDLDSRRCCYRVWGLEAYRRHPCTSFRGRSRCRWRSWAGTSLGFLARSSYLAFPAIQCPLAFPCHLVFLASVYRSCRLGSVDWGRWCCSASEAAPCGRLLTDTLARSGSPWWRHILSSRFCTCRSWFPRRCQRSDNLRQNHTW